MQKYRMSERLMFIVFVSLALLVENEWKVLSVADNDSNIGNNKTDSQAKPRCWCRSNEINKNQSLLALVDSIDLR